MAILFDIKVESGASQWYGVITIANIRHANGSAVGIDHFLGLKFRSPAAVQPADFNIQLWRWQATTTHTENARIDSTTWDVEATIDFEAPYTFAAEDTIKIGINGDLTGPEAAACLASFALEADALPDTRGTVFVQAGSPPDAELYSAAQTITFTQGSQVHVETVAPGATTPVALPTGTYTVSVDPLANAAYTVAADAAVHPATVTLTPGSTSAVVVSYSDAQYYARLNVAIERIQPLLDEELDVSVVVRNTGDLLAEFLLPPGGIMPLGGLPRAGVVDISVAPYALNNVRYTFPAKYRDLDATVQNVLFSSGDMQATAVDTGGFVALPVEIASDVSVSVPLEVRLVAGNMIYRQEIRIEAGTHTYELAVPVQPQTYTVEVADFLLDGQVYHVQAPDDLRVAPSGASRLLIAVAQGANLNVRGFPDFLSFGGCADLTPGNAADFVAARASSVFKYAGFDGAGDANTYLTADNQTTATVLLARDVEQQIGGGHQVLPVLVSYTCNLSLGDTPTQLANKQGLAHSLANLILSLNLAKDHTDASHPVPAGYVINPDFLGACQQGGFGPGYAMPVREPLRMALDHWNVQAAIPEDIEENIRGYIAAVNWLIRTVAPAVTFGWQVNLWGVGASEWIYASGDEPVQNARATAEFIRAMRVHEGPNAPDFLAVDRYEADDFTIRSYANGYCYWTHEWGRFFDFCAELSRDLRFPIMPWQIPASHAPLVSDPVNDDFDTQNWGTGGTYIFGDSAIGSDYHNINPKIVALKFPAAFHWAMGATAEDMFKRSEPFDVSGPAYADFPYRGIFTLLLGGGATTGIIASVGDDTSFVRDKLNAYMSAPIPFTESLYAERQPATMVRRPRRRVAAWCGSRGAARLVR
ncbi:hypothetical protein [Cupriavidus pauculus]|uniref:Uncharacterized protein n=1 Tax=Cupriavidus pauculus TaxID=82633 RepID=A0A2N5C543_9BURK|nr:hypothetical protein [Cupriavidus pauculus]PLP97317.1 hypothetical protein CYJ10_27525 [Cupriavidus pauculus]